MPERHSRSITGQQGNTLMMLLAILTIVFCIFKFIQLAMVMTNPVYEAATASYFQNVHNWFVLPSNPNQLLHRPWTFLTYMFLHEGVFHLIGNLIWLWVFGYILQDLTGNKSIAPLFIYGALAGALFYLLALNFLPAFSSIKSSATLEGASAGIMAIALATTILAPNYRLFPMIHGGIPLWIVTVIYVLVDVAMIAGMSNPGGHISHIGGAVFGWLYMVQLKKGKDWGTGMNRFFYWSSHVFSPAPETISLKIKEEIFYETAGTAPFKKMPNLTQKRIDSILDKIGEQGYNKLTEEEKQILKRAAEDDNL